MEKKTGYNKMIVSDTIPVACSNMAFFGDFLYYYATEWNNYTSSNTISYGVIDIRTKEIVSTNFITDGTDRDITIPYGIAIHPETGDIFVTDAKIMFHRALFTVLISKGEKNGVSAPAISRLIWYSYTNKP